MDNTLFRTEKPLTNKEILTYWLNMFNNSVIANLIDLCQYQNRKKEDPQYKVRNERGELIGVDALITAKKNAARYARENAEYIKTLIQKDEDGTLSTEWSNEALAVVKLDVEALKGKK